MPETDFQVIDPALRNCAVSEPPKLVGSSTTNTDLLLSKSSPSRDIFVDHQLQNDEHQNVVKELKELLAEDESRNQVIKKLILEQQQLQQASHLSLNNHLLQDKLPLLRDFFHKRAQLMLDLDPIIHPNSQKGFPDHHIDVSMGLVDPFTNS
jgi:hypothetical protein